MTKFDNSTSYVTFSEGLRDTNGPRAARGITLSKAAATSFSTLNYVLTASGPVLFTVSYVNSLFL